MMQDDHQKNSSLLQIILSGSRNDTMKLSADLHMHMVLDGDDWKKAMDCHKAKPDEEMIRARLAGYRKAGVAFLRDGGDKYGVCLKAKDLAPEYGITYITPYFPIHKKGHYGGFIGRGFSDFDEYSELVDTAAEKGADFIKLMISGLMDFSKAGKLSEPPMDPDDILTMIDEAHDQGFAVMAHCNGAQAAYTAARAGVESIEHGAFLNKEAMHAMADAGTIWIPTLAPIANLIGCGRFPDKALEYDLHTAQENIKYAVSIGIPIGAGSDAGAYMVPHVKGTLDEYALLRKVLGERTEEILAEGETRVRKLFG